MNLSKYKMWIVKQQAKRKQSSCVFTWWKSTKKWRMLIHRMITKQRVKNEQIKKKQTCYLCFVNKFKFQKKTSSRSFRRILGNKDNINQKRFLGKATSHSDHCMINVSSQRLKIGGS